MPSLPKVIIVGGGFSGIIAAKILSKSLSVTLITKQAYFTFLPLLPELAAGHLPESGACFSYQDFLPQVNIIQAEVKRLDFTNQQVMTNSHNYPYDYLLVCTGAEPQNSGISGMEAAYQLYDLEQAMTLRQALTKLAGLKQPAVISVVGGGYTGLELILQLAAWLRQSQAEKISLQLFHRGKQLLDWLPAKDNVWLENYLRQNNITPRFSTAIDAVTDSSVSAANQVWPSDLTIIVIGVKPITEMFPADCLQESGRVVVNHYLQVFGQSSVFASGDIIALGQILTPQLAQLAVKQARAAAQNILAQIVSRPLRPYQLKIRGLLISLGSQMAVGQIGGRIIKGRLIWFLCRAVYWFNLPSWRQRRYLIVIWAKRLLGF